MSATKLSASATGLRRHFQQLYARAPSGLDSALQALLPPNLADSRVTALRSSAFVTVAGVDRLVGMARCAVMDLGHPERPIHLLDLGCGVGRLGAHLAASVRGILTGIDFADSAIAAMRRDRAQDGTFVTGDIRYLPFRDASFDLVMAIDTLHVIDDLARVLQEARRVLNQSGTLIGTAYRLAGSPGLERPLEEWKHLMKGAGFVNQRWCDVTSEWRSEMRAKHGRRWERREELVRSFGLRAIAECDVSRQMLGLDGHDGFIEVNERWEFSATD